MDEPDDAGRDGREEDGDDEADVAARLQPESADRTPVEGGRGGRRSQGGRSGHGVHGTNTFRKADGPPVAGHHRATDRRAYFAVMLVLMLVKVLLTVLPSW